MHFAVLSNNFSNARLLLKYKANVNAKDGRGNTPMHYAVSTKNLSLVRMLDDFNANALAENEEGLSAIDIAVSENMKELKLHFMNQQRYQSYDFSSFS